MNHCLRSCVSLIWISSFLFLHPARSGESPLSSIDWASALYVSPSGSDQAKGTREDPLATVGKALSRLPDSGEGVIALLGGIYTESLSISKPVAGRDVGSLIVTAAPGETVILEGGRRAENWTPDPENPSLYIIEAPNRQYVSHGINNTDVWENGNRVRYRRQFDRSGVQAFPGSYALLDEIRILVHPRKGMTPESADLWHNQYGQGWGIQRDRVTLQGIHFRNYLGGSRVRALTIGSNAAQDYHDVVVRACSFENSVMGISMTPAGAQVLDCDFRDVGLGLVNYGTDTVVRNCVIQAAAGQFAITDLNQHVRDGIRYYYDASGGEISGNVIVGFFAGFYYKSRTASPESRPMLVTNNLFLAPIVAGVGAPQLQSRYFSNIIGPSIAGGLSAMMHPYCYPAEVCDNYAITRNEKYFATTPETISYEGRDLAPGRRENNQIGEDLFIDLLNGDLRLRPGIQRPEYKGTATMPPHVEWTRQTRESLAELLSPVEKSQKLAILGAPTGVRSDHGALITVKTSLRAKGLLHYRKKGASEWQHLNGVSQTPLMLSSNPHVIGIFYPDETLEITEQRNCSFR